MDCPTNSKNWLFLDFDNGGNNQFEVANADGDIILKTLNIVKTGTTVSDDGAYVFEVIAHGSSRVINVIDNVERSARLDNFHEYDQIRFSCST